MSGGRGVPVSTYRLQLQPQFTLYDAARHVPYLASLGVSHLYLSPVLQATPGSTHGYDVVDHRRVDPELGGDDGLAELSRVAGAHGLRIVVDVVPNHMAAPTPLRGNAQLWSVLREGRRSAYAAWFDVDWDAQDDRILMPVLGRRLEDALRDGELQLDTSGGEPVVRYYEHEFPVAEGTQDLPLPELLERQHYRLAHWRRGGEELNYRRFFDVTSLVAVRVERPAVFDATHEHLAGLVDRGVVDGLRIDHPDGLADPQGYLARLAERTGGAWVVVEKILEGEEELPTAWACAGTTGYDALLRVGGLFVDPEGEGPLTALSGRLLGHDQDLDAMSREAKEDVVDDVLVAEVDRLHRGILGARPDLDPDGALQALRALLVSMERYRAYVTPGEPAVGEEADVVLGAAARARALLAGEEGADAHGLEVIDALDVVVDLVLARDEGVDAGAAADVVVRFQQTCGPVMAKGVEDTVFYRHVRLTGLNEVGGDPGRVGVAPAEFHAYCARLVETWPHTMTTLSTHDTKRSEDVRARLAVLAERPAEWAAWVEEAVRIAQPHRGPLVDPATAYLLWQTLVGAWPISADRFVPYAVKAVREAKVRTTWTDQDRDYEAAVEAYAAALLDDPAVRGHVEEWTARTARETRAVVLGQKLVQLTMPGVPDVYQGTEVVDLSLVDPDNRRLVDHAAHAELLRAADRGQPGTDLGAEKLALTAAALRLRRERPADVVGPEAGYEALSTSSEHLVAFARGPAGRPGIVVLATRLAGLLSDEGGWQDATVVLPDGTWRDVVTGRVVRGGVARVAEALPDEAVVALLARVDDEIPSEAQRRTEATGGRA